MDKREKIKKGKINKGNELLFKNKNFNLKLKKKRK